MCIERRQYPGCRTTAVDVFDPDRFWATTLTASGVAHEPESADRRGGDRDRPIELAAAQRGIQQLLSQVDQIAH